MSVKLNYYVVALVDVLGQQSLLSKLRELPTTDEEKEKAATVIRQTLVTVSAVREAYESFLAASQKDHPVLEDYPDEVANAVREVTKSDVSFSHFSDTTIIYSSLTSPDENPCLPTCGILDALAAVCFVQMETLAAGIAVRGGIEIGLGSQISEQEVYGPVLSDAHYLESRVAGYPRIVAGPRLVGFLDGFARAGFTSPLEEVAFNFAQMSSDLLMRDEDGLYITDFAGSRAHEVFRQSASRDEGDSENLMEKAIRFAESQYKQTAERGDFKLAGRYSRLTRYLHSREDIWTD